MLHLKKHGYIIYSLLKMVYNGAIKNNLLQHPNIVTFTDVRYIVDVAVI